MTTLSILQFNDVYRVGPQKLSKTSGTIDVTQFGALLEDLRSQWKLLEDGVTRDGLVLFSGDLFSPSVESSITRGSHMVPVMNELAPDVALAGNHDFDFGYPHLTKLIQDTSFPWILSNIIDEETGAVPAYLHEFRILERAGIRIGIIGLVESEWIQTISSWPPNFKHRDMTEVGMELSTRLRDPEGAYKCDLIIALTHCRIPNDLKIGRSLNVLSPKAEDAATLENLHGVDLILGGHDHAYYVSKGVTSWNNYDVNTPVLGSDGDQGDVLVVKSGTDFRDLSEVNLVLEPTNGVRRYLIKEITGTRHSIKPEHRSSEQLKRIVGVVLSSVSKTMKAPVCVSETLLDLKSQSLRTGEAAAANWFADVVRHAYDDALCMQTGGGSDGVLFGAGTLRGDSTYGPGVITLGNIMEILPFEDPVVVIKLDGAAIWEALEAALSKWPAQEGRFPIVSGLRVEWNSTKPPGERVVGIWTLGGDDQEAGVEEPVINSNEGRTYKIVTREYLAQGYDGFDALKRGTYIIDDENGELMSSIVRKYLLGSHFIRKMAKLVGSSKTFLSTDTLGAISRAKQRNEKGRSSSEVANKWKRGAELALKASKQYHHDKLKTSRTEHLSVIDPFDGEKIRRGKEPQDEIEETPDEDLLVISPVVDGRLKDIAGGD